MFECNGYLIFFFPFLIFQRNIFEIIPSHACHGTGPATLIPIDILLSI